MSIVAVGRARSWIGPDSCQDERSDRTVTHSEIPHDLSGAGHGRDSAGPCLKVGFSQKLIDESSVFAQDREQAVS